MILCQFVFQNFPDPHSHNLNCNWHLLAPLGNNITIMFSSLILESSPDCRFDYVNITEVQRPHPFSITKVSLLDFNVDFKLENKATLCGNYSSALPPPIRLLSNEAIITFVSDDTRSIKSGFRLEWGAVGCGAEYIYRKTGLITSPNFPNPYPHNVECLWHIKARPGHRVDLTIHVLDLEFSQSCNFDNLRVFAGPDENSPRILNVCNQAKNLKVSSVGDSMTIKLESDLSSSCKNVMMHKQLSNNQRNLTSSRFQCHIFNN